MPYSCRCTTTLRTSVCSLTQKLSKPLCLGFFWRLHYLGMIKSLAISSWPQPIGPPLPLPLCLRPSEGSASSPQLRGLPATCPLPIPHAKRDRGGRRPRAPIPAPHRGDRQQLLYPGLLRLPGMHFQAPSYLGAAAPGSERPEETGSLGQS